MQEIKFDNPTQTLTGASAPVVQSRPSPLNSFGKLLQQSMDQVNRLQVEANARVNEVANGEQTDIHQTMIAVEKAEVSFELLMQIRNKVVAAYEQIMRTQV